jgi:hypothetical protein
MDDDSGFDNDPYSPWPGPGARRSGETLTLALLEDLAAVLQAHGFPPLSGYALVELTSSLYRLMYTSGWSAGVVLPAVSNARAHSGIWIPAGVSPLASCPPWDRQPERRALTQSRRLWAP